MAYQKSTSKLARLANSSISDVGDANLRAVVSFRNERTSLKLVTVDANLDDVTTHLWRIKLDVMNVTTAFDDPTR